MSKLEGKKVKIVKSTNDLIGTDPALCTDLFHVGFIGTIIRVYDPHNNKYPVVIADSVGRSDIYMAEQLRYLNNREVVV